MSVSLPPSASSWWSLFDWFFVVGVIAGALVVAIMVHSLIKYRDRKGRPGKIFAPAHQRSPVREAVIFGAISAILLFSLAVGSYRLTTDIQYPPSTSESLVIDVTAFQWGFNFYYPNNVSTTSDCYIPSNKSIIFNVTSRDVMHNFGLPDFKLKIDAIPGRYNVIWIDAPSVNANFNMTYQIRCYELCGTGHTYMLGRLIVLDPTSFDLWLNHAALNMTGGM